MSSSSSLYAFDLCDAYPLPENRIMVRNPRNGRQAVLTPDVYGALTDCRLFRTLDDHARHLTAHNPGLQGHEDAVREVLESVRADGLLISARVYETVFAPTVRSAAPAEKLMVAVLTCDRPESLRRLLESVSEHCDLRRVDRFSVIDDSRQSAAAEENRELAGEFAARVSIPVIYLGAAEQQEFMDRIIQRLPALETAIRFLLDRDRWAQHWTGGLARTVALLSSVGERLLILDDDILCEVHELSSDHDTAVFADSGRSAIFYGDANEWSGLRAREGIDPFVRHAEVLGLPVTDALGLLGISTLDSPSFEGADVAFLEALDAASPILITECGTVGDPGTVDMNWLAALDEESLQRLLESEDTFEAAVTHRNCWTARRHPHFSPQATMSPLTGLDNRRMLPPYLPIMRNEDRLFGDMTRFLYPRAVTLDQAWAVPHLPPGGRESSAAASFDTRVYFPRFFHSHVADNLDASPARDPLKRMIRLAELFEDLAERSDEEIVRHHLHKRLEWQTRNYRQLKSVQARTGDAAPAAWRAYLDSGIRKLNREMLDNPPDAAIRGYPRGLEGDRLTGWWRDFWRELGHAIRSWPAIRQTARDCLN